MKIVGLMSGTSADGIDAALLEIGPGKALPKLRLLHFAVFAFPAGLRQRILRAGDDCPGGAGEFFIPMAASTLNEKDHLAGQHRRRLLHPPIPLTS